MLKDRLLQFIESQHISIRKFEKLCGFGNGYVSSLRKGLGEDKLNQVLSTFPQLNKDWLLYGDGEMIKDSQVLNLISQNDNEIIILKEQIKLLQDIINQKEKLIQQKDIFIEQLLKSINNG